MYFDLERRYWIGLDLAKAKDFSTLSVIEQRLLHELIVTPTSMIRGAKPRLEFHSVSYVIKALYRWRLGTPYTAVVAGAKKVFDRPSLRQPWVFLDSEGKVIGEDPHGRIAEPTLVADATGIGGPVMDMLRETGLTPIAVTLTSGDHIGSSGGSITIPKRDAISAMRSLFEKKELTISKDVKLLLQFEREYKAFRVSFTPSGKDTYSASGSAHDDLLLATCIPLVVALNQHKHRKQHQALPQGLYGRVIQR